MKSNNIKTTNITTFVLNVSFKLNVVNEHFASNTVHLALVHKCMLQF